MALDAVSGEMVEIVIPPTLHAVHGLAVDGESMTLLTADVAGHLSSELAARFLVELSGHENASGDIVVDSLTLLGFSLAGGSGSAAWYEILSTGSDRNLPEVSITADCGKLYVVNGALVEVRDLLTGRALDDWTIPGLDEQVGWQVSHGAGLLAEEHRISVFELPA